MIDQRGCVNTSWGGHAFSTSSNSSCSPRQVCMCLCACAHVRVCMRVYESVQVSKSQTVSRGWQPCRVGQKIWRQEGQPRKPHCLPALLDLPRPPQDPKASTARQGCSGRAPSVSDAAGEHWPAGHHQTWVQVPALL